MITIRMCNLGVALTTRNFGFSYKNFWGNIIEEISSESIWQSKRVPFTKKRWAWQVFSGWSHWGNFSSKSLGSTWRKTLEIIL